MSSWNEPAGRIVLVIGLALAAMGCTEAGPPTADTDARNVICRQYLQADSDVRWSIVKGSTHAVIPGSSQGVDSAWVDKVCQAQPDITVAAAMRSVEAGIASATGTAPAPSTTVNASSGTSSPASDGSPLCRDFLVMSQADRDRLVSQIAVDRNETRVLNPAWRGNVEMVCGEHLDRTVGVVIDSVAGK